MSFEIDDLIEKDLQYNVIDTLPTPRDVNTLIQFEGTILRTSNTKLLENKRTYKCTKCKSQIEIEAQVENCFQFEMPPTCGGTLKTGEICKNKKFTQIGEGETIDYQEIRIQEPTHTMTTTNGLQRQVTAILLGEIVGEVQTGDFVTVKGIVKIRWVSQNPDEIPQLEIVVLVDEIIAKNVDKMSLNITQEMEQRFIDYWEKYKENQIKGRDLILQSLCPELYGLKLCKLAVLLVALGGVSRIDEETKTKIRGTIHLLLVGDPGTGKSQLLNFASQLGTRHIQATGGGTTSAGLTVSVVNIGGELSLDAGALVLADGGVCCIDEFSAINKSDRADIHEAMEQQTLSVAKAGIVSQLHTRTSILAATNPKGKYDPNKSMSTNTGIDPPLLSRFDLILLLLDERTEEWDKEVSDYVLNGHKPLIKPIFTVQELQCYITYVKLNYFPEMTEEAEIVIQTYFQYQRSLERRESGRTTIRLLESLVRISQAHAKLMMHKQVLLMDAVMAVLLIESSLHNRSNNKNNSEFPDEPDTQFEIEQIRLLKTLKIEYLIDENEMNLIEYNEYQEDYSKYLPKENEDELKDILNDIEFDDMNEIPKKKKENRKSKWIDYMNTKNNFETSTGIIFPSQYSRNGQLKKGQTLLFKQDTSTTSSKTKSNEMITTNEIDIDDLLNDLNEENEKKEEKKEEMNIDDLFDIIEDTTKENKEKEENNIQQSLNIINSFSKFGAKQTTTKETEVKQIHIEENEKENRKRILQDDDFDFDFDDIESMFQDKRKIN